MSKMKLTATSRNLLQGIHAEMTTYGSSGAVVTGPENLRTAHRLAGKGLLVQDIDRPQMWTVTEGGRAWLATNA